MAMVYSGEWYRGNELDRNTDMILKAGKGIMYWEIDTGEMSYARVEKRWESYEGFEQVLVVVSMSARRRDGVMNVSQAIAPFALFGVHGEIMDDPTGPVWLDWNRNKRRLHVEQPSWCFSQKKSA